MKKKRRKQKKIIKSKQSKHTKKLWVWFSYPHKRFSWHDWSVHFLCIHYVCVYLLQYFFFKLILNFQHNCQKTIQGSLKQMLRAPLVKSIRVKSAVWETADWFPVLVEALRGYGCVHPFSVQWSLERRKNDFTVCPVVHKALTWDWGWGCLLTHQWILKQPFIKWVIKKYIKKYTKMHTLLHNFFQLNFGDMASSFLCDALEGLTGWRPRLTWKREYTKPLCS